MASAQPGLGRENWPVGHVIVPFDQRRPSAGALDDALVEGPDGIGHGPVMRIDQERRAGLVGVRGMAGEVDLADVVEREGIDIGLRRRAVIGRARRRRC